MSLETTTRDMRDISITVASVEAREESIIDVDLERPSECCIYRVPRTLRKINEEAYTPKVISIGPLHHGKVEFADMEKQKIRYKREFVKRITPEKWQQLVEYVEGNEQRIRDCYAERSELQNLDFVGMILYDAVFIIELFLRHWGKKSDFLLDTARIRFDIQSDLQLLENQLPFFVLKELYGSAICCPGFAQEHNNHPPSFFDLACQFFQPYQLLLVKQVDTEMDVKHFTDLRRSLLTRNAPYESELESGKRFGDLPGAVKLQESGLKFNGTKEESFLDIKFERKRRPWIPCQLGVDHVLQIPRIEVDDQTESLLRNLMALEQCHYPRETMVCNYVDVMDMLIDTVEDVHLLTEQGIISNNLGESRRIAKMFNKLCLGICFSRSHFYAASKALKDHYGNPFHHARATLIRVYFNNPWRSAATVAAVLLLVLTVIQTACSIHSSVR